MLIFCPYSIDWGNVAQWAGAIFTCAAVLVALRGPITEFLFPPKLHVEICLKPPDSLIEPITVDMPPYQSSRYMFRLYVRNRAKYKKALAEKVQIFANKLEKLSDDGQTFILVDEFLPMRLEWSYNREKIMDWLFPHDMGKHCDLCHITKPDALVAAGEDLPATPSGMTVLTLNLEYLHGSKAHVLSPGTYKLYLIIACLSTKPIQKTVEIWFSGYWRENQEIMFRDEVRIRIL
jgi:hypothetical protein